MNTKNLLVSLLIVASLACLSGCVGRKKGATHPKNAVALHDEGETTSNGLMTASEPLDTFVLKDEENAFTKKPKTAHTALQENVPQTEESWTELKEEQAKLGLKKIFFDFDRSAIREDQKESLNHDLKIVKNAVKKGNKVIVEGHACRFAGSATYNMMLSEKRADTVAQYFVKNGVPANKLNIVGRGCEMPIVPEGNKEQQAPNRRVELYTLKAKK